MLIPMPDAAKHKVDVVTVIGAVLGWLNVFPWPQIAAMLACVYTTLRIAELVWDWIKRP